jgi:hypothetical protein
MPVVPTWNPVAGWMHFRALTASGTAVPVYTLAWRIEDHPDEWSTRLVGFKSNLLADVRGASRVLCVALPALMKALRLNAEKTGLTVALSSAGRRINMQAALARIGKWLSEQLGIQWIPDIFAKEPHRALHLLSGGSERDSEVHGKYTARNPVDVEVLFVLDDLVTRGATFNEMRRALHENHPNLRVIGIALGKNERKDFAEYFGVKVDNSHVPTEWGQLWSK